ncbi:MAG: NHL repeat-containing protein [Planctomycetota bacterium]|nr:NHL repeat-containing protein [Planctomycetota bacterium]
MHALLHALCLACLAAAPIRAQEQVPVASAAARARFGQFLREVGGLSEPGFAAIDAEGRLWVTESFTGALRVFGADGGELARFPLEVKPGVPREPRGVAISPAGEIYVSDALEQKIVVLDGKGLQVRAIGKRGAGPGELREPRGIAIADGKLYVADSGNHRIGVYALDGQFERAIGRRGFGDGELLAPNDVAVDAAGRVFVADLGNQRVARFEKDGAFGKSWGGLGPYSGLFHAPTGIAERGGRVFVADRDNHRVQVFDGDGKPDHEWGVHAIRPREGGGKLHYPSAIALSSKGDVAAVVEGLEGRVQFFGHEGDTGADPPIVDRSAAAHYEGGCDVAGNLLAVLEPAGPSVSIFDMAHPTPIEITRFGRSGPTAGKFLVPADVEFAADGKSVWVSDPLVHRISQYALAYEPGGVLRFDPYMARFVRALDLEAAPGLPAAPWPTEPTALELGPDGSLYVADRANARVLVFGADMGFLRVLGEAGTGPGRLLEPASIAVGDKGLVHVADARGRKVESFDNAGKPRGSWPIPNGRDGDGRPRGIAAAAGGGFWITAEDAQLLVRADAEGIPLATIGTPWTPGLGKLQFFHPGGLARDAEGGLVLIDAGNHRFQVLTKDGEFRTAWGSRLFLEPILKAK